MGAKLNRGGSKQDYATPPEFIDAVKKKFHLTGFNLDAAAGDSNTKAPVFYDEAANGLLLPWETWTWCNPPYANIEPWVKKAYHESLLGHGSMLLLPASVGANWWKNWVHDLAHVHFLNGRITFVGQTDPYPKDCALLVYTPFSAGGYNIWSWME